MNLAQRFAAVVKPFTLALLDSPRWSRLVNSWMTVVTYKGRRSGRTFRIPVGYSRQGEVLTIPVEIPDQKNWWRNFVGDGGPIHVRLQGVDRRGHANAGRDHSEKMKVKVALEPNTQVPEQSTDKAFLGLKGDKHD